MPENPNAIQNPVRFTPRAGSSPSFDTDADPMESAPQELPGVPIAWLFLFASTISQRPCFIGFPVKLRGIR